MNQNNTNILFLYKSILYDFSLYNSDKLTSLLQMQINTEHKIGSHKQ